MERSKTQLETLPDQLKLKYLSLVCQLKHDKTVLTLKTFIFPLEEALKICEKFGNLQGQAHIKWRTRSIEAALTIYIKIMQESLAKSIRDDTDYTHAINTLADMLFAYQMIIEICKNELDEMFVDGQKYFNKVMDMVFEMYATLAKLVEKSQGKECQHRVEEVLQFVKYEILDDFMSEYISRLGTVGLAEVSVVDCSLSRNTFRI